MVYRIVPLRPSLLRLSEAIDYLNSSSVCFPPVSTPVTSTCSHSIGTLSALKISLTDSETSAPTPSPSILIRIFAPLIVVSRGRTWDKGDSVLAAELGRSEKVAADGSGHGYIAI